MDIYSPKNLKWPQQVYITGRILDHKIFGNFTWNYGDADDEVRQHEKYKTLCIIFRPLKNFTLLLASFLETGILNNFESRDLRLEVPLALYSS